ADPACHADAEPAERVLIDEALDELEREPRPLFEADRLGELKNGPVLFPDRAGDRPARIKVIVDRHLRLVFEAEDLAGVIRGGGLELQWHAGGMGILPMILVRR